MSLIHDALRKAAEENQNRHGQRDRPASWRDVAPPPPPKRSPWPWVTAAAFLAAGGAFLLWTQLRPAGPAAPPPVAAAVAPAAVPATVEPPAAQPVAEVPASPPPPAAPAPVPAVPESRPAPPPASTPAARPPETAAPAVPPASPPPTPATSAPAPAAAAPNPAAPKLIVPPAQTGQVDGDTYVLEAEIEGKRLLLDFIVWSDAPFAQINGRQVGIGQQVEGFVVTDIARESVLLETPTRRIRLRVR